MKLKKETERNNSNDLIIGRTKEGEEVSNQIDNLAKEFEESDDKKRRGGERSEMNQ